MNEPMGIREGGCVPPDQHDFPRLPRDWPDKCWPPYPPPPEPNPEDDGPGALNDPIDWMTYSHHELYNMVHQGMDLTEAMSVSADWAKLGDELSEIGEELNELIGATAAAWEGPAAELAKGSATALADWSTQTGASATEVSAAITREVDAANTARNNMPFPIMTGLPKPPVLQPAGGTVPSSAESFTGTDFASAQAVFRDPGDAPVGLHAHQQAARVMQTFQTETREIHGTVPQFAPPDLSKQPRTPTTPEPPAPQPQPQPTGPAQSPSGGPAVAPIGGGGGGAGASPAPGSSTQTPKPGAGVAAGQLENQAKPGAAPAAAAGQRPSGAPGGMGGMPMGGMGGARGGEDVDRKSSSYLEEDEDLWGLGDNRPTPPVIGEDRRRA